MAISSAGVISWTPGHAESGNQSVTVTATDGSGRVAYQNFTISVIRLDNAPAFTSSPVTTAAELITYSYNATASDPDGDPLKYSLAGAPTGMTINSASGRITWTPTSAQVGNHTITVIASDSPLSADLNFTPLTATQTFTIAVAPNHPPVIGSAPVTSATENSPYSYTVTASDPDGDALSYTLSAAPEPTSARAMFERRLKTSSIKRGPKPRSIATRLGRASVASRESGIDSGKRM